MIVDHAAASGVMRMFYEPLFPGHHFQAAESGSVTCDPCGELGRLDFGDGAALMVRQLDDLLREHGE